jgi:hypothetical protein
MIEDVFGHFVGGLFFTSVQKWFDAGLSAKPQVEEIGLPHIEPCE